MLLSVWLLRDVGCGFVQGSQVLLKRRLRRNRPATAFTGAPMRALPHLTEANTLDFESEIKLCFHELPSITLGIYS